MDVLKIILIYLFALSPFFGLIYYLFLVPKKRNISNSAILKDFSFGNIASRILVYGEITLVAVIVNCACYLYLLG